MLVATPFFPAFTDYDNYAKALSAKGQCDGHTLLVVTQRQDEEGAIAFANKAGKRFSRVDIEVVDAVDGGRSTAVSNALFKAAIYFYRKYEGLPGETEDAPLLYNDPTWHPHKAGWLDSIQSEYFAKGCPKGLCRWRANDAGEKVTRGPILLSKEYALDAPLLPHIPATVHWRNYLRHELGQVVVASETISTGGKSVLKPVRSLQPK